MKTWSTKQFKANVSLTTVIVTGTILLLSGMVILLSTMDLSYSSKDTFNYELNMMRTKSCLEEALARIKSNTAFTGSANITFSDGNCAAAVTNDPQHVNIKLVEITSVLGDYTYLSNKKIDINCIHCQYIAYRFCTK